MHDDPEAYWNEVAGPNWVSAQERLDRMLRPIMDRLMQSAGAAEGERVIDVGCGCGATTLALASRVGATGSVLGVDISAPMLERARKRNEDTHVRFERADAATHPFLAASSDLVLSRFGIMFFSDPTAAFANMHRALKPEGRCVFACWQSIEQNPWMMFAMLAAADVLPPMQPPPKDAPGPFRFADREWMSDMLREAGFASVAVEPLEVSLSFDGSVEEILAFFQQIGPLSRALDELEPKVREQALALVRAALTKRHEGDGITWPSASYIVRATP